MKPFMIQIGDGGDGLEKKKKKMMGIPDFWYWYFPNEHRSRKFDSENWQLCPHPPDKVLDAPQDEGGVQIQVNDSFDYKSLLFTPSRDYLLRSRGPCGGGVYCEEDDYDKVYAADLVGKHLLVFGLCIPVIRDTRLDSLCQFVNQLLSDLALDAHLHDVEVVFVTRTAPDFDTALAPESFNRFFAGLPGCLAVPFSDAPCRRSLYRPLGLMYNRRPCVVVTNKLGKVTFTGGGATASLLARYGAAIYPNFTQAAVEEFQEKWSTDGVGLPIDEMLGLNLKPCDHLSCPCRGPDCRRKQLLPVSDLKRKLVLLYIYVDGTSIDVLLYVLDHLHSGSRKCDDYEVVVTYAKLGIYGEGLSQDSLRTKLLKHKACGWLEVPFRHWVSAILWEKFENDFTIDDRLIAVGPYSQYVEPYAKDLINRQGWDCGLDYVYPFTIKSFVTKVAGKVSTLTLSQVLKSAGVKDLIYPTKKRRVPVRDVVHNCKVVLWLGYAEAGDMSRLVKRAFPGYKVIFACLGLEPGYTLDKYISGKTWYAVPMENLLPARVYRTLLGRAQFSMIGLFFVYGSDGRLCSMQTEDLVRSRYGGYLVFSLWVDLTEDATLVFSEEIKLRDYVYKFDGVYLLKQLAEKEETGEDQADEELADKEEADKDQAGEELADRSDGRLGFLQRWWQQGFHL